jgi:peptidyl-dipeptidase Dcp
MTYSENRALREKLFFARASLAFGDKQYDNVETLKKIVELRHERALLLGHSTHADFVLEERMAKNTQTVKTFLADFLVKSLPAAKTELQKLQEFAVKKGGPSQLQHWDLAYWQEQMKHELYQVDDEELRQYFKLDNVLNGVFEIAHKLYGITFKPINNVDKYHPAVETFEVLDKNNKHLAVFYADFFPRPGKRSGAWMTSYREQYQLEGREYRPHVSIVCNFSPATASRPSLLTIEEVLTLFHEFGHALHGIFAEGHYDSLNGTNVFWDFVELPSQIMENWVYEKEALHIFAKHFETDQLIPDELIDKVIKSKNFMEGMGTLRQIRLGMLDMEWHGSVPEHIGDVISFETQAIAKTEILPRVSGVNLSCSFSHIFAGGYSAGYYSYKWAEVLDADAFALFKQKGIFNQEVASSFRSNVLSRGGQEHPMDLYCRFRGQAPTVDALLKRSGLLS